MWFQINNNQFTGEKKIRYDNTSYIELLRRNLSWQPAWQGEMYVISEAKWHTGDHSFWLHEQLALHTGNMLRE